MPAIRQVYDIISELNRTAGISTRFSCIYRPLLQTRSRGRSASMYETALLRLSIRLTKPGREQVFRAFWNSFEQEFKPDIDNIQRCSNHVKERIALAQTLVNLQEQQLQALEREKASTSRSAARKFFLRTDNRLDKIQELQVQSNARKTRQYFQRFSLQC